METSIISLIVLLALLNIAIFSQFFVMEDRTGRVPIKRVIAVEGTIFTLMGVTAMHGIFYGWL